MTAFLPGGAIIDLTDSATSDDVLLFNQPQRIHFCDGPFSVNINASADVELIGFGTSVTLTGPLSARVTITNAAALIDNLILTDASPAIMATNADLSISNTMFQNNFHTSGGAIHLDDSSLVVSNSVFENNTASLHGGALFLTSSEMYALQTDFYDNNGTTGGAIYGVDAIVDLDGGSLTENNAISGGAVYLSNLDCSAKPEPRFTSIQRRMLPYNSTICQEVMAASCDFAIDPLLENDVDDVIWI